MIAVQKGKDGGNRTQFERQISKRKQSATFVSLYEALFIVASAETASRGS
jgi:hypothetical protein